MAKKAVDQLGEMQRQILKMLWDDGGLTVQEVLDRVNRGEKQLAYTTILSTLQTLERAGWVKPKKEGRAYRYHAAKSRREAAGASLREFVKRTFGGDKKLLFESLLGDKRISDTDLETLKQMIEDKQRENQS
ncbi:MAG: BlaI/MecI/CopY family transcriptional regulator [Pirellulaceae bacterium]|nr:BlaI/MecI/CopY family transcriptional regulator [Pirellulaceae bacterium]